MKYCLFRLKVLIITYVVDEQIYGVNEFYMKISSDNSIIANDIVLYRKNFNKPLP